MSFKEGRGQPLVLRPPSGASLLQCKWKTTLRCSRTGYSLLFRVENYQQLLIHVVFPDPLRKYKCRCIWWCWWTRWGQLNWWCWRRRSCGPSPRSRPSHKVGVGVSGVGVLVVFKTFDTTLTDSTRWWCSPLCNGDSGVGWLGLGLVHIPVLHVRVEERWGLGLTVCLTGGVERVLDWTLWWPRCQE